MPIITLTTQINAPIERCFDLSRSIDLHKISTAHTSEEAIDGVTSGLIKMNETVTWRARHFGVNQKLTTKITAYDAPYYFVDEMVKGIFKSFRHTHCFELSKEGGTSMKDKFDYVSPFGVVGKLIDQLVLKNYMSELLINRNVTIKKFAESELWKEVLT